MRIVVLFALLSMSCALEVPSHRGVPVRDVIDPAVRRQTVTLQSPVVDNQDRVESTSQLPAILALPDATFPRPWPAVVVLHGSGGLWKNDVQADGLASQFETWAQRWNGLGAAVLFIDSYSPRGTAENVGAFKTPPGNRPIAAEYVRPRDAYAGLAALRSYRAPSGTAVIQGDRIVLMGFSHGGTAVLSTLADTTYGPIAERLVWTQSGFEVPPPAVRPARGGFAAAVAYYPGTGMYGYFGSYGSLYRNYAPLLIQAAGLDPLYQDQSTGTPFTATFVANGKKNLGDGAAALSLEVYPLAEHSFDGPATGSENAAAREAAQKKTVDFLSPYLFE